MLASWLRRLTENRFTVPLSRPTAGYLRPYRRRLGVEALEERWTPANAVTVDLVSLPLQPTFGQAATFTATVQAVDPMAGTPTGSVTFFVDGVQRGPAGGVQLDANDQASIAVPTEVTYAQFQGGPHTVTASYSGDPLFDPSSATLTLTVSRAASTTALVGVPNPSNFGQGVTFTATVTGDGVDAAAPKPTGDVVFVDTTTGTTLGERTLNGSGQASLTTDATNRLGGGLHVIRADYIGHAHEVGPGGPPDPGDQNYAPTGPGSGSGTFTATVNQDSTSTSVVSDHPGASIFGEPVTFTATVSNTTPGLGGVTPSGTVTFTDSTTGRDLGSMSLNPSGVASLLVNDLTVTMHRITAAFLANANFTDSSGGTTQTVAQGTTSSTIQTSKSPTVFGEPVTFTATVTANAPSTLAPAGSVTFVDTTTGTTLGTSQLFFQAPGQSRAMLTSSGLGTGPHIILGTYNTDGSYATSSASTTQQVNPAPTTTTVFASANPSVFGQPVTYTALVSAAPSVLTPAGAVSFFVDGVAQAPLPVQANGQASFTATLDQGLHAIIASYTSSSGNFTDSRSPTFNETVNPAPTTTSLFSSRNPRSVGQPVTFTAVVSAAPSLFTPTGTVTFRVDGAVVGRVVLDPRSRADFTTTLGPGINTITASYDPDTSHFLASAALPLAQVINASYFAVGVDSGSPALVRVFDATTGAAVIDLTPYGTYQGGARVAVGDVNGDGFDDIITGAGPGAPGGHVKVFSGNNFVELFSFFSFPGFNGGVFVAAGDVDGDGRADILVGAGAGAPGGHVKVFNAASLGEIASFFSFPGFAGGITVAAGDVNGDGLADVIVGAGSGAPGGHVKAFNGGTTVEIASFFSFPGFNGGVNVAAGDVNGDGRADIIVGAASAVSHVKVFNGASLAEHASFFAFPGFNGGVRVGATDRDGDGDADLLAAHASATPLVSIFSGTTLAELDTFFILNGPGNMGLFVGGSG